MSDAILQEPPKRRTRKRPDIENIDRQEIADRVISLYENALTARSDEESVRIQREAKIRLWQEEKDWPWENASNINVPDILEKSLRVQDTLHNAVMSQRPPIGAKALDKSNKEKERLIDQLIDFQVFVEQPGEKIIGDLAAQFVNDGVFTAFIPWVKERRPISDLQIYDPIPENEDPEAYFAVLIESRFANMGQIPSLDGWNWTIIPQGDDEFTVAFYTRANGEVEMVTEKTVTVYDGPRIIPKAWADVIHHPRAANLQIPGPANPGGAPFVILRDRDVTVDEIVRLSKGDDKFYDLMDAEDIEKLTNYSDDVGSVAQDKEQFKDDMQGVTRMPVPAGAESHKTLTRLVCFDRYDIDGDGVDEDVVWWVLLEPRITMRARRMSELYPADPPRRPFAEAAYLPIEGRRCGMSLPEIMEGIHDAVTQTFNQMLDSGTMKLVPFGFYRPSGSMKPETIRLWPGEMYPLNDPKNDIYFPPANVSAEGLGINIVTMLQGMGERVNSMSAMNFGRVPPGASSAMRTSSGIAQIAGQGDARPERILRRFFAGLCEIWAQIHELNQAFLPKNKQFRIVGYHGEGKELFGEIGYRDDICGRFAFDFAANVLNTSKQNLQQSLMTLAQMYISQISIQLGIAQPDGIYRLLRDIGMAWGQDADKYISPPSPDSMMPRIFAEDAVNAIMHDNMPEGRAAEAGGEIEHFQKLTGFAQSDNIGLLSPGQVELFGKYLQQAQQRAVEEHQQQQMMAAAQAFQQQAMQGGGGQQQALPMPPQESPLVASGNELIDESLPGAGGGASGAPQ